MFKCSKCKKEIPCNWKRCEKCDDIEIKKRQKLPLTEKQKERLRVWSKKWRQTPKRKKYIKKWRLENKERIKKYNKNYYKPRNS